MNKSGVWTQTICGDETDIAWTQTPKGIIRLDCRAWVHGSEGIRGRQEELEDLLPCWHARQDIKDRIGLELEMEEL